jgi:uncharacterized membrane protein
MLFAWMFLRPVTASQLEPPQRLRLWVGVFRRFFPWVWAAVIVILVSGVWMIFGRFGGPGNVGLYVHLMMVIGLVMAAIFLHVFFAPFQRLKNAVDEENWPAGGRQLGQIRRLVGINAILGVVTIVIATAGRYLLPS